MGPRAGEGRRFPTAAPLFLRVKSGSRSPASAVSPQGGSYLTHPSSIGTAQKALGSGPRQPTLTPEEASWTKVLLPRKAAASPMALTGLS